MPTDTDSRIPYATRAIAQRQPTRTYGTRRPSKPGGQGVAGSNPVVPTVFVQVRAGVTLRGSTRPDVSVATHVATPPGQCGLPVATTGVALELQARSLVPRAAGTAAFSGSPDTLEV